MSQKGSTKRDIFANIRNLPHRTNPRNWTIEAQGLHQDMARAGQVRLESFPPRDLQGWSSLKQNGFSDVVPDERFRDNIPDPTERLGS